MVLVKEMISRVESEHRTKLEQLSSVQEEQRCVDYHCHQYSRDIELMEFINLRSSHSLQAFHRDNNFIEVAC